MSVEGDFIRDRLERKVVLPTAMRIALAVVVIAGGVCFGALGPLLLFLVKPVSLAFAAFCILLTALGLGFLWVGIRLARLEARSAHLLADRSRRWCSLLVGAVAALMLGSAWVDGNLQFLASGLFGCLFSWWLVPRRSN